MSKKLDIKNILNKEQEKTNSEKNSTDKGSSLNTNTTPTPKKNLRPSINLSIKPKGAKNTPWYKNPTLWVLAIATVLIIILRATLLEPSSTSIDYGTFLKNIKDGNYSEVKVFDFSAQAKKKDQKDGFVTTGIPGKAAFSQSLKDEGIAIDQTGIKYEEPAPVDIVPLLINAGLTVGAILLFIYFLSKQTGGNGPSGIFGMGESKARMVFGKKQDVNFDSVAGIEESKEELKEIVDFLKTPQKYTKMGARIPKGVLLVGPPGTGKTLLARAVSGEAGVPFFFAAGSEFEELLVGAGAARVRDLFSKAKKAAPAIIFIDEIDAMARKRGSVIQSTATEQTLNQILVEMDGFDNATGVIVMAATNRADVLDPAILRPGRFDRRVNLELPDKESRKQIIAVHIKNKPIAKDVDLDVLARRTGGFSGADLENMLNESAIITAKANRSEITYKDIEEAVAKIMVGPAKRTMATERDRKIIAYHEAGHAIVGYMTGVEQDVHRITIIARGSAGGYTEYIPQGDDNKLVSRNKILSMITSALAGNATERLIFDDITTGASDDFEKATNLARRMVTKFGMGDIGPMVISQGEEALNMYGMQKEYSDKTAEEVDSNVSRILNECYEKATDLLKTYRNKLDKVVQVLFEKETIEGDEFKSIMMES